MKIIWSQNSSNDLDNIWKFISEDSEHYATIFISKIINAVDKLIEFPKMGRIVPEINQKHIRELIFQNYRVIYKTDVGTVVILSVIHGARNLKNKKNRSWEVE